MKQSLYNIPDGCICMGDGLYGMRCPSESHAELKSLFQKAWNEFTGLHGVAVDNQKTIADCVFTAQFEIDLFNEGDSELTPQEVAPIRRFVKKWTPLRRVAGENSSVVFTDGKPLSAA